VILTSIGANDWTGMAGSGLQHDLSVAMSTSVEGMVAKLGDG
jgi:hypothetical protein